MHETWEAETKDNAEKAFDFFIKTYEAKYPKATLCLQKDREELMAFFDFFAKYSLPGRAACMPERGKASGPATPSNPFSVQSAIGPNVRKVA